MARFASMIAAFVALIALVAAAPVQQEVVIRDGKKLVFPKFPRAGTGQAFATTGFEGAQSQGQFDTGSGADSGLTGAGAADEFAGAAAGSAVSSGKARLNIDSGPEIATVKGDVKARRRGGRRHRRPRRHPKKCRGKRCHH